MNIGITGVNGFLGSKVKELLSKNHLCEGFDKGDNKYSLYDINSLIMFVKNKEIIIHIAGANRDTNEELLRINVLGTLCLMEAIRLSGNKAIKVILSSSFQVYPMQKNKALIKEIAPNPESAYGISKMLAEDIILRYSQIYGINAIIFRISNIYGPKCKPYYNSVIATLIDTALEGKTLSISSKNEGRDFIFVGDVAEAFEKAIHCQEKREIFNICSGQLILLEQVAETIRRHINKGIKVEYGNVEPKGFIAGSNEKAKMLLGFNPKTGFNEGIKKTAEWFKEWKK